VLISCHLEAFPKACLTFFPKQLCYHNCRGCSGLVERRPENEQVEVHRLAQGEVRKRDRVAISFSPWYAILLFHSRSLITSCSLLGLPLSVPVPYSLEKLRASLCGLASVLYGNSQLSPSEGEIHVRFLLRITILIFKFLENAPTQHPSPSCAVIDNNLQAIDNASLLPPTNTATNDPDEAVALQHLDLISWPSRFSWRAATPWIVSIHAIFILVISVTCIEEARRANHQKGIQFAEYRKRVIKATGDWAMFSAVVLLFQGVYYVPPAHFPGETAEAYIGRISRNISLGLLASAVLGALALAELWTLCKVDPESIEAMCHRLYE
jgi:hypothetical protein